MKTTTRWTGIALFAATGALAGASLVMSGCNIAAAAFYIVHGPDEKVPAKFTLPPDKTTVVFVDDRNNRLPSRDLREMIATAAGQLLLEEGAVVDLVDARGAIAAAAKDRFGEPMTISEIGRSVGASTVVYVTIDGFALSSDGQSISPVTKMRVKVLDAQTETRLWPPEQEGYPLGVQSPPRQGTMQTSAAELYSARQEAAGRAGLGIAQLFTGYIDRYGADKATKATQ
jgi:hypothetical protein